ncbi:antitoxin VbhA family protein [uncultured Roseibium sp.]|uniref:antitoxin VbhA family protein n=1 Tax=uncultured Roseibium sp. TaxID=1936171 RepID=UPI0026164B80|nr:antitoxin VbhA family protein [uncultured Roseibium sp.]
MERLVAHAKARSAQAATDRSPKAVETRRRAIAQATASNRRAGYVHDPVLEAANERYIAGDITIDEHRAEMVARYTKGN